MRASSTGKQTDKQTSARALRKKIKTNCLDDLSIQHLNSSPLQHTKRTVHELEREGASQKMPSYKTVHL